MEDKIDAVSRYPQVEEEFKNLILIAWRTEQVDWILV